MTRVQDSLEHYNKKIHTIIQQEFLRSTSECVLRFFIRNIYP